MSRDEIQKLLGGYATDTLSDAERQELFAAALEDQELFDALAKEQALREVLDDPGARRQLLEALEPAHSRWYWLRKPAVLAFAGGVAVLVIAVGLVLRPMRTPKPELVAEAIKAPAPPAVSTLPPFPPEHLLMAPKPAAAPKLKRAAKVAPPPSALIVTAPAPKELGAVPSAVPAPAAPPPAFEMARVSANLVRPYSVLLRDSNGEYTPAPPDTVFHAGDAVRIQIVPADSGYLHLYQRDASGAWQAISTQPAIKGEPAVAPSPGALEYDGPGQKELLAVVSPQPEAGLAQLKTAAGAPRATLARDAVARPAAASKAPSPQGAIRITLVYQ